MTIDFHPAAARPRTAALLAFGVGLVGSVVFQLLDSAWVAAALMLAFVGSLSAFFFPSSYRFEEDELWVTRAGSSKFYPLARFRSFQEDRNGIFLSPFVERHALDELRGLFLPMESEDRRRLSAWLEQRLLRRGKT